MERMLLGKKSFIFLILLLLIPNLAIADKVWLNTNSGVYHCPGTRWYANTKKGKFIDEKSAITKGYRPAYGNYCDPKSAYEGKSEIKKSIQSEGADIKVWVNTKSNVYHCPGTRYYGNTKRGNFLTQEEALLSGNRAAYGKKCY